jgi:signal transduction histidine kinase
MKGWFSLSALERRVFSVAIAALLPVAALSCLLLIASAREQQERLYRGAEDTVLALLNATDAGLKSSVAALDAFAASPRLARGDFERLHEEALQLLERRPGWRNLVVADQQRQYMNARLPPGGELPEVMHPESIAEIFRRGAPNIGNVMLAPLVGTYGYAVQVPYAVRGKIRYAITAVISPDTLLELLDLEHVANQGVISVVDRGGHIVARSLFHEDFVGKRPSAELVRLLAGGKESGRAVTRTLEGVPVYTVFRRSEFSGWVVALGIPRESIETPMRRAYLMLGAAVLFSVLVGIGAALLVGRTIVQPMRELEEQAARVGRGEAPALPKTRLPQVQRVAVALAAAHAERESLFQSEHAARIAAENASKAKDEFLAMLGHELRNPLSAISNASVLIERQRGALPPTVASATAIINRQAKHLTRLTDDLLDAGRVILGKVSLVRAPLDLASAVRATLDGLRSTGRLESHRVEAALEPTWIFGDATRIDQVISNLLTNSLKYTPAGGRIEVTVRQEVGTAVLQVRDTGIGLEAELLPRVFELFVQGERALDRSQGGLGIGLTLVKRLVELHNGTVTITSEGTGSGTTVTVSLPLAGAGVKSRADDPASGGVRPRTIAVIEDNADARESLRMLLELDGHRVHEAVDGESGIALLRDTPGIDVAFVDIGLPGIDGLAVAREVRALRGRSIRLVAMSGYGAERDVARGADAGFDDYIVKPADAARLQAQIAQLPEGAPEG